MRILVVCHNQAAVGGVERYVQGVLPTLYHQQHEVALLVEKEAGDAEKINNDVPEMETWCASKYNPSDLKEKIQAWNPDVVYEHGLYSGELREDLLNRYPCVLFAHGYYGTCVSGSKCFANPSTRPCNRLFGLGCLVQYFPRRCGGWNPYRMWHDFRRQSLLGKHLNRYRRIVVASNHMRAEYVRHGIPENRVVVVHPLAAGAFPDSPPPQERKRTNKVLMVGRLTNLKGGEQLIRALSIASEQLGYRLELHVAGDGPQRVYLEQLAGRLKVDVHFHGWVDRKQRLDLMRSADILAVPSVWPEPFGLVGIEAGCVGLPSVAFAVGGISDWLKDGVSGRLVSGDSPNPVAFAGGLVDIVQDTEIWNRFRRGAWECAKQLTAADHVKELESVLTSAMSE